MVLLVDLLPSGGVLPHHKTVIIFANCMYKHRTNGARGPGGPLNFGRSIKSTSIGWGQIMLTILILDPPPKFTYYLLSDLPPALLPMDTIQSAIAPLCYTFISNSN